MSTNKTPNLKLHSWEPLDPFKREEINENFTWLDLAVGALNNRVVKLTDITFPEAVSRYDFDMTGNRWADYNFIVLRFRPKNRESRNGYVYMNNDGSGNTRCHSLTATSGWSYYFAKGDWQYALYMLIFTGKDECRGLGSIFLSDDIYAVSCRFRMDEIKTLNFTHNASEGGVFEAGTTLEIWGVV